MFMTNWTPSEGLKRAETIVEELLEAAHASGVFLPLPHHHSDAVLKWRMMELIAKAIDQALAEIPSTGTQPSLPLGNGANEHGREEQSTLSMVQRALANAPPPTAEELEPYNSVFAAQVSGLEAPDEPKKRRGRAKGSKAKRKAKAKAAAAIAAEGAENNAEIGAPKKRGRPSKAEIAARAAVAAEAPAEAPAEAASE